MDGDEAFAWVVGSSSAATTRAGVARTPVRIRETRRKAMEHSLSRWARPGHAALWSAVSVWRARPEVGPTDLELSAFA
ncbi:hypothetical protein GCM10027039_27880 [Terrabacter koreensis]